MRLVAQGALAEREPDGDVLFFLAAKSHVPARLGLACLAAVDGFEGLVLGSESGEPLRDRRFERLQ